MPGGELRYYGFRMEVENSEGVTKVRQFRKAVTDLDGSVDMLNSSLGDNVTVTARKVQNDKEAQAQAKLLLTQQERQIRRYDQAARALQHQIDLTGKNRTEQAQLNAVYSLGARATKEQRDSISRLAAAASEAQQAQERRAAAERELIAEQQREAQAQQRQAQQNQNVIDQYQNLINVSQRYAGNTELVTAQARLNANATEQQRQELARLVTQYQAARNTGDAARRSMRRFRGVAQNLGWQLQDVAVQLQMGANGFMVFGQQGSQLASSFGAWGALIGAGIAVFGAAMPTLLNALGEAQTSTKELDTITQHLNSTFDQSTTTVNGLSKEVQDLYELDARLARLRMVGAMAEANTAMIAYRKQIRETIGDSLQRIDQMQQALDASGAMANSSVFGVSNLDRVNAKMQEIADSLGLSVDNTMELAAAYRRFIDTGNQDQLTDVLERLSHQTSQLTPEFGKLVSTYAELAAKQALTNAQMKELQDIFNGTKPAVDKTNDSLKKGTNIIEEYNQKIQELGLSQTEIANQRAINQLYQEQGNKLSNEEITYQAALIDSYFQQKEALDQRAEADRKAAQARQARLNSEQRELDRVRNTPNQNLPDYMNNDVSQEQTAYTRRTQVIQNALNDQLITRQRYNQLIEQESQRHNQAMADAQLQLANNNLKTVSDTQSHLSNIVDLFSNGVDQVKQATENMNAAQKTMYVVSQGIAAAQAIIDGITIGMKLAAMFPIAAPAMIATGTAIGAAQAGAIMGTTFAGAFDKGGFIPSGQQGIVAEYGNELVNGVMVNGPARVTSREDTAKMMNSGGGDANVKISIENQIPGGNYQLTRLSNNDVKIIARQVFNDNIDSGVAGTLSTKGTKADKAMRAGYQVQRKYS